MTFASLIGLIPAVAIGSPAQATQGNLAIVAESATEGSSITFYLTYSGSSAATYSITTTAGDAIAGTDYTATPSKTTVTFAGSGTSDTVTVTTLTDVIDEADETFTLTAASQGNSDTAEWEGTIEDDDGTPSYQLTTTSPVTETALTGTTKPLRVTATLSAVSGLAVSIPLRTNAGTAISTSEYPDFLNGFPTLSIPAGQLTGFVEITIVDDTRHEDTFQTFTIGSNGPPVNTSPLNDQSGVLTINIQDDDAKPTVAIGGAGEVVEGSPLGFPLTLSAASEKVVTVEVTTTDGQDDEESVGAVAGEDYTALPSTVLSFPAETTDLTAVVQTTLDTVFEASPEALSAAISNPVNATLGDPITAKGAITDDDDAPTVTLSPLLGTEGDSSAATTNVIATLSGEADIPVVINYTIGGGTATSGTDYTPAEDSIEIAPGQLTGTIPVEIIGDTMDDDGETLSITLSTPNMTINTASVGAQTFTITDNDAKPTYTVGNVSEEEGDEGDVMRIPVTLSNPSADNIDFAITSGAGAPGGGSDTAVVDGDSPGSDDYDPPTGTLQIVSGQVTGYITVAVNDDDVFERDEIASIGVLPAGGETMVSTTVLEGDQHSATLTLENDDAVPVLTFTESSGTEGTIVFLMGTITGSAQDDIPLDLEYTSYGDNAADSTDYFLMESNDRAIIEPGDSALMVGLVLLNQDTIDEPDESFMVIATAGCAGLRDRGCLTARNAEAQAVKGKEAPSRITAGAGRIPVGFQRVVGEYTINDDPGDLPPTASISDESIGEAEGSVDLTVSLAFTGTTTSSQQAFTLPWWTQDGTAIAGLDYVEMPDGMLIIPIGETSGLINVEIINDRLYELDKDFSVRLGTAGPAGATVSKSVGEVTIESEDAATAPTMLTPTFIKGPGLVVVRGVSSPGSKVELMLGKFGTSTPLIKKKETQADSRGNYSFAHIISAATRFGVRADGLDSTERTVRIMQLPVLAASSGSPGRVTLSVLSNPRMAGQTVYLQRLNTNGRWSTVAQGTTSATNNYVKTMTGYRSGTVWSFRAYVVGSIPQGTLSGYSTAKKIRIR
jgi:hypothetical protein